MYIRQSNPRANYLAHRHEIDAAIARTLESGRYILGEQVEGFEREFAAYLGVSHCVGTGTGTDALQIALRTCGIGHGDVVMTVSHTSVATVAAIELSGAMPLFVDIDIASMTISPENVESALQSYSEAQRIKAIIPVHLYGHPAKMTAIGEIAKRYKLLVIEDCAQAHGALIGMRKTGTMGDIAAFSFYPTKNLGALGDGGAIATSNPDLAERARLLREYGWKQRYVSSMRGMNSRLDEIQAAILRVKLEWLDRENMLRQLIAQSYDRGLKMTGLVLPQTSCDVSPVFHQYVVRSNQRDQLREYLEGQGIETSIHYPSPVHLQPAYYKRKRVIINRTGLPVTEKVASQVLSLPMHPHLTEEEVECVYEAIRRWKKGVGSSDEREVEPWRQ
ncbi:MAG: DegT/DnrJ/EryC1/StrS family aminotransferase [Acidobacteria bacterium]|nr:DegT/DnrJ/EryC1/StrS family aminotransferase [Acidobacteriota bacterium]